MWVGAACKPCRSLCTAFKGLQRSICAFDLLCNPFMQVSRKNMQSDRIEHGRQSRDGYCPPRSCEGDHLVIQSTHSINRTVNHLLVRRYSRDRQGDADDSKKKRSPSQQLACVLPAAGTRRSGGRREHRQCRFVYRACRHQRSLRLRQRIRLRTRAIGTPHASGECQHLRPHEPAGKLHARLGVYSRPDSSTRRFSRSLHRRARFRRNRHNLPYKGAIRLGKHVHRVHQRRRPSDRRVRGDGGHATSRTA